jgi:hypothetical protein
MPPHPVRFSQSISASQMLYSYGAAPAMADRFAAHRLIPVSVLVLRHGIELFWPQCIEDRNQYAQFEFYRVLADTRSQRALPSHAEAGIS